ncbi:NAD(P)-dependent oxidoreductase [Nonomuraea sp. GTA35]|uniref:NAD(P)-dependent oxidoreductase n=1 Tax=Nonomuraea sp. GTA35 TaxID=1676746 RepID=UPI0035BF805A
MRVTVFGATGGIGRLLVQQLLDAGHQVTALVRSPAKLTLTHPNLNVIAGQLSDTAAVRQSVQGTDAVISALGPSLKRSATGTGRASTALPTKSSPRCPTDSPHGGAPPNAGASRRRAHHRFDRDSEGTPS